MVWLAEIYNLRKAAVGIESRKLGLLVSRFLSIPTAFPCSKLYTVLFLWPVQRRSRCSSAVRS